MHGSKHNYKLLLLKVGHLCSATMNFGAKALDRKLVLNLMKLGDDIVKCHHKTQKHMSEEFITLDVNSI